MILLTGYSGFLGRYIYDCNAQRGQKTLTMGRGNCDFICDLRKNIPLVTVDISMVIHAAGKAHMFPKTAEERQSFFNVNVTGTQNLLMALEKLPVLKSFIFISSVAVYGKEKGVMINENEPLLAKDPYGQSKILAENIVMDWCRKHNVICVILRLPLIVGKNPPGNLGAMINGIKKGYYFNIAGGRAKKSMVLATDVAEIISHAAEIGGIYNLTDGYHPSFAELSNTIAKQLGKNKLRNLPLSLARIGAFFGDFFMKKAPIDSLKLDKIMSDLTFDDSKARMLLGWKPNKVLSDLKI